MLMNDYWEHVLPLEVAREEYNRFAEIYGEKYGGSPIDDFKKLLTGEINITSDTTPEEHKRYGELALNMSQIAMMLISEE